MKKEKNEYFFAKTYFVLSSNSKNVNQTAHLRSLSFVFAVQDLNQSDFIKE